MKIANRYEKLESDINLISITIAVLWISLVMHSCYQFSAQNYESTWASIASLGIFTSALLVAKIATRGLLNAEILKLDSEFQEKVKTLNHSLAVINDISQRIALISDNLLKGEISPQIMQINSEIISKRWEVFYEKDIFLYITPKIQALIGSTSADILGVIYLCELIQTSSKAIGISNITVSANTSQKIVPQMDKTKEDLNILFDALLHLRNE